METSRASLWFALKTRGGRRDGGSRGSYLVPREGAGGDNIMSRLVPYPLTHRENKKKAVRCKAFTNNNTIKPWSDVLLSIWSFFLVLHKDTTARRMLPSLMS